jgi:hypothetical protein
MQPSHSLVTAMARAISSLTGAGSAPPSPIGRVVQLGVAGVHAGDRLPQAAAKADQLIPGLAG